MPNNKKFRLMVLRKKVKILRRPRPYDSDSEVNLRFIKYVQSIYSMKTVGTASEWFKIAQKKKKNSKKNFENEIKFKLCN